MWLLIIAASIIIAATYSVYDFKTHSGSLKSFEGVMVIAIAICFSIGVTVGHFV